MYGFILLHTVIASCELILAGIFIEIGIFKINIFSIVMLLSSLFLLAHFSMELAGLSSFII